MPGQAIKVFLDTNVLKFAADRLERLVPNKQSVNWAENTFIVDVFSPTTILPNENIKNEHLKSETRALPAIADLAFQEKIELLVQFEVIIELLGLPGMHDRRGPFYGAPITRIPDPIKYGRIIVSGLDHESAKDHQLNFLMGLDNKRFKELQKACGAYQGNNPPTPNQLLDAFHVYCAECANSDYFLTCDFNLLDHVRKHKKYPPKVKLVKPTELLSALKKLIQTQGS